jgi:hypothetical protein
MQSTARYSCRCLAFFVNQSPTALTIDRDPRIDFFRGAALFMILFDHVGGDPLGEFTFRHLGLSDAAEIFVFLSGVSCAIAYSRILIRRGLPGLFTAIIKRSAYIYIFCLITSIVTILLIIAANSMAWVEPTQPLVTLTERPLSAITSSILLTSPPELAGILVLYIQFTLIVVPAFLLGAQFSPALILSISAIAWIIAPFYPELSPPLAEHSYFPLASWQFLFSIGMFVGLRYYSRGAVRSLKASKYLIWIACAIVTLSFLFKVAHHASIHYQVGAEWFPSPADFQRMKERLSPVRLAHFLSVAFLVATYIQDRSPFFNWPVARMVIQTGRHSLEVFCISAILSVLLNLTASIVHLSILEKLLLDCCAIFVVLLIVGALSGFRKHSHQYSVAPSELGE